MTDTFDDLSKLETALAQRDALVKALEAALEVIRAASLMANVCYNAKQNADVPEGIRTWLANTQEGFDKARDAYLAAVGGPSNG